MCSSVSHDSGFLRDFAIPGTAGCLKLETDSDMLSLYPDHPVKKEKLMDEDPLSSISDNWNFPFEQPSPSSAVEAFKDTASGSMTQTAVSHLSSLDNNSSAQEFMDQTKNLDGNCATEKSLSKNASAKNSRPSSKSKGMKRSCAFRGLRNTGSNPSQLDSANLRHRSPVQLSTQYQPSNQIYPYTSQQAPDYYPVPCACDECAPTLSKPDSQSTWKNNFSAQLETPSQRFCSSTKTAQYYPHSRSPQEISNVEATKTCSNISALNSGTFHHSTKSHISQPHTGGSSGKSSPSSTPYGGNSPSSLTAGGRGNECELSTLPSNASHLPVHQDAVKQVI